MLLFDVLSFSNLAYFYWHKPEYCKNLGDSQMFRFFYSTMLVLIVFSNQLAWSWPEPILVHSGTQLPTEVTMEMVLPAGTDEAYLAYTVGITPRILSFNQTGIVWDISLETCDMQEPYFSDLAADQGRALATVVCGSLTDTSHGSAGIILLGNGEILDCQILESFTLAAPRIFYENGSALVIFTGENSLYHYALLEASGEIVLINEGLLSTNTVKAMKRADGWLVLGEDNTLYLINEVGDVQIENSLPFSPRNISLQNNGELSIIRADWEPPFDSIRHYIFGEELRPAGSVARNGLRQISFTEDDELLAINEWSFIDTFGFPYENTISLFNGDNEPISFASFRSDHYYPQIALNSTDQTIYAMIAHGDSAFMMNLSLNQEREEIYLGSALWGGGGRSGMTLHYNNGKCYAAWINPNIEDNRGSLFIQCIEVDSGSGVESTREVLPTDCFLSPNFPNPFNPSTTIPFDLQRAAPVTIKVFNVRGQLVSTLLNESVHSAGYYQINFDGSQLASGVYVYTISAGNFHASQKMVLMK